MSAGKQHTFASLMEDVDFIEIPILQRDYAQGTDDAADVREAFLSNLRDAITGRTAPLDLDFIYGSISDDSTKTLSVLDGQQRLTTLFLLHWYLALSDGEMEDFGRRWAAKNGVRSRFSYATRPTATDFFQAIVTRPLVRPAVARISQALQDEKWFFDTWLRDPTVHSCCNMLDAIESQFRDGQGLYRQLVDARRVTFHFLELRNFGLSDDLYIKMNARGKALTPFENLKAWVVERVAAMPWGTEFALSLDQSWTDLFWKLAGMGKEQESNPTFDELFLRYFYIAAFFAASGRITGSFWGVSQPGRDWIARLRDVPAQIALRDLETHDALNGHTLWEVMRSLDYFAGSEGAAYTPLLQRVLVRRPEYDDLLMLHAVIAFQLAPGVAELDRDRREAHLSAWTRVTTNLIRNSRIEEPSAAVLALKGLSTLAGHATALYPNLANGVPSGLGFSREQVEEEVRKAALVVSNSSWEPLLRAAESHWYLQGRVGFLLDLSADPVLVPDQTAFSKYASAAAKVLSQENLNSSSFVLQRALLSLYDFMPAAAYGNHTFCIANATAYRDRLENWLPVIQDPRFRQLLDLVIERGEGALRHMIDNCTATDWRTYLVADPQLISYCGRRMLCISKADILLLTKIRLTGFYAELRSLALFYELQRRQGRGELGDVKSMEYREVYGEDWPELILRTDTEYKISYRGSWQCVRGGDVPAAIPNAIAEVCLAYAD